ncbi:hypothetical protein [Pseudoroseomonas ludipueritiae]|uniref:Uncharacterized protein n=1 Tax=Pseudoroseomonas ludipueritiae TaxID=198093 RepID=A0ABR7R7V3_9PROT|nr:hypothetical protein [Pseudoroseomonas ludipueritiae]MBC9177818.1 hypothetical protein [Pseudoroseomonas ludipueritiae]MCG7363162.1 hypothetical protein [Roseomonas sp. ACRSG]
MAVRSASIDPAPVQETALPVNALPVPAMPRSVGPGSRDVEDVTDGAAIVLADLMAGWTLQQGGAYTGLTLHQAIRWIVGALRAAGYLREIPEPGTPALPVHPPVACMLEVYQLLTQMLAATAAGQVVAGPGQDHAALAAWAANAQRTLAQHRAVAQARGEQHA